MSAKDAKGAKGAKDAKEARRDQLFGLRRHVAAFIPWGAKNTSNHAAADIFHASRPFAFPGDFMI